MDPKISRIVAGTVYGVQPNYKKKQNADSGTGHKFTLEPEPPRSSTDPEEPHEHEHLHVSKAEQDEAGGHLDLTA